MWRSLLQVGLVHSKTPTLFVVRSAVLAYSSLLPLETLVRVSQQPINPFRGGRAENAARRKGRAHCSALL
ncbi:unnamed protein product [Ectocarpus sp. CCAP 1310/34]|nr:unnamed protein product [Ectocarpus sp. CCAP 1310/34]